MSAAPLPKILIVYDSRAIRETVSILGFCEEYDVVELDGPDQLEDACRRENPDLVVLCVMTASSTAYASCRQVKAMPRARFLPVMIYSLQDDAEQLKQAYEAGADASVQVTISPEAMLYRIRTLLRIRDSVRKLAARKELSQETAESGSGLPQTPASNGENSEMPFEPSPGDEALAATGAWDEPDAEVEPLTPDGARETIGRLRQRLSECQGRIGDLQGEVQRQMQTLRHDLDLAASLQIGLLPDMSPLPEGVQINSRYIPAATLGGDYYDYIPLDDGRFFLYLVDVSGHGVAPALVGVQVRTRVRSLLEHGAGVSDVMTDLNRFMLELFRHEYFMTCFGLLYDSATHQVEYAGAGHCPAIQVSPSQKVIREHASRGLPLGVSESSKYPSDTFSLRSGDRLFLYTDGIAESQSAGGESFSVERIQEILARGHDLSGGALLDELVNTARVFSADGVFSDDVTLLLLGRERHGRDGSR